MKPIVWTLFFSFCILSNLSGQTISTIAGTGEAGYSGDGGSATIARLNRPINVKFGNAGNLYIVDNKNNAIRQVSSSGVISTIVGTGIQGYSGDGGAATNAKLHSPVDIALDTNGNIYIADAGNSVIRKVTPSGVISTIAGTGTPGFAGDGGAATSAKLYDPVGLVFDNNGVLFFSDGGNARVRKISSSGIITTVAGNGMYGYSGDGGPATNAKIGIPNYLALSSKGEIYIPDHPNNIVRKVDTFGIISTIAGNGTGISSGDGGLAISAGIISPQAIIFDKVGNFYISSYLGGEIRMVNVFGIISTVVGTGNIGFSGDGGPATACEINLEAICSTFDVAGNMYIADSKNNRIRKITYNTAVNEPDLVTQNVSVYPNPTNGEVNVVSIDEIKRIEIVNIMGRVVMQQIVEPAKVNTLSLKTESLPSGVYFVKVNGVFGGKFVKQ